MRSALPQGKRLFSPYQADILSVISAVSATEENGRDLIAGSIVVEDSCSHPRPLVSSDKQAGGYHWWTWFALNCGRSAAFAAAPVSVCLPVRL